MDDAKSPCSATGSFDDGEQLRELLAKALGDRNTSGTPDMATADFLTDVTLAYERAISRRRDAILGSGPVSMDSLEDPAGYWERRLIELHALIASTDARRAAASLLAQMGEGQLQPTQEDVVAALEGHGSLLADDVAAFSADDAATLGRLIFILFQFWASV